MYPQYVQNPDVNKREEDEDGLLLFNPDTNGVLVLNNTAKYIWHMCKEPCSVETMISGISGAFSDVPLEEVKQDVEGFLDHLVNEAFLGVVEK